MEIRQAKLADVPTIMKIYGEQWESYTMGGWLSGAAAS